MLRIIVLLALILKAPVAQAADKIYRIGDQVTLTGTVLCDKLIQIETIVRAQQQDFDQAWVAYNALAATYNGFNEPVCELYIPNRILSVTLLETIGVYQNVEMYDGNRHPVHITKVRWTDIRGREAEGYITFHQRLRIPNTKL